MSENFKFFLFITSTELALKPIQSIFCYVICVRVVYLSPLSVTRTKRVGDFWSKSVSLKLQNHGFDKGFDNILCFEFFWFLFFFLVTQPTVQSGGGSVAVAEAVGIDNRWQVTCDILNLVLICCVWCWCYYSHTPRYSVSPV